MNKTIKKEAQVAEPRTSAPIVAEKKPIVKNLTDEMVAKLKAPLPKEAVSQHPSKSYLSSIKAIYVVERLNDVFGIGKWQQRNEIISDEGKMKTVHSFIDIPEYGIYLDNFGGNDNVDEGDAFKGAVTDALTKMASYLGIGMDVYKGLVKPGATTSTTTATTKDYPPTAKQLEFLQNLREQKGFTREELLGMGLNPKSGLSVSHWIEELKTQGKVQAGDLMYEAPNDTAKIMEEEGIGKDL